MKPDKKTAQDRGETLGLMEPLTISQGSRHRSQLMDIAMDLASKSSGFRRSLPPGIYQALAKLVRTMNCYYSNLIEDHNTHPIDIERSMDNDYSQDPKKRDLQIEAKAHILCQQWIDEGDLAGRVYTVDGLMEIHRRFCENLPEDLLWVEYPDNDNKEKIRVIPGELRKRDVRVGKHYAVSPGALSRFMKRFEDAYSNLGKSEAILAAAAAHHRLVWIHPFIDGNGRVARLMSHAAMLETLDTGGVWSVARGLARSVDKYKSLLQQADLPRRNDLDGRGSLSEEGLAEFTLYFLEVCRDQVKFMEELVQPDRLRTRILLWVEEEIRMKTLPDHSGKVLDALLYRGELPRGDIPEIIGAGDRQARRITSALLKEGVLTSESPRAPLRLAFPAKLADRWMPNLFPEKPG
ncbi:Fic family protein [Nitrospina watsonii]|uniref:Cell filamentation protein Fic n=1 Tax=Nitrospina watsonii TaxID=1323948 RepID=A0ABN8VUJ5_9BACT|nr:Fic family protein [Nitrospina watsonii]CAI2717527.1 Cell filamentation protein Fic [Nitrospina watsonii]